MEEKDYTEHALFIHRYLVDKQLTSQDFFTLMFGMIIENAVMMKVPEDIVTAWLKAGFELRRECEDKESSNG